MSSQNPCPRSLPSKSHRILPSAGVQLLASRLRRLKRLRPLMIGCCMLVANPACKSDGPEPQTGSETNFLQHCNDTCAPGFTCLCGMCTRACTGTQDCSELADNAQCVAIEEGTGSETDGSCQWGATCDFACVENVDCASLGSDYRCETGFCRKGDVLCPTAVLPAGDETRDIVVGGVTRTYTVHVPDTFSGDVPVPLVLDFHAMGAGALQAEQASSGYQALSDQEGFILVWPQGMEDSWNIGPCCTTSSTIDDFGFARAIVRRLSAQACIDPTRVYAVGFSMGGAMAYYLACKQAEIFAAIAVSSMDLFADATVACEPSRPVAEISFRGNADTVVPYDGGTSSPPGHPEFANELLGAVGTFEKWASLDSCTGTPSAQDAQGCSTYATCQGGAEVTLCTIEGGGQVFGDASTAWEMLTRHPMP